MTFRINVAEYIFFFRILYNKKRKRQEGGGGGRREGWCAAVEVYPPDIFTTFSENAPLSNISHLYSAGPHICVSVLFFILFFPKMSVFVYALCIVYV